jgi:uncharacterized protein (DUF4415 family)
MKKKAISKRSQTDWERVNALRDDEIDLSDIPEITPEMFARGVVRQGLKPVARKQQITIRVDSDVLDWYKRQGQGYQTKINSLLRAYMQGITARTTPSPTAANSPAAIRSSPTTKSKWPSRRSSP